MVGLGNPGADYVGTRHNVGFLVVDVLAGRGVGRFSASRRVRSDAAEGRLGGPGGLPVVLAKPHSYMNESGGPVAALCDSYAAPPERLVIVHDELDLPYGSLRCKMGGGDNGHNGLKSVRRSLGTGDFLRVRVGIGRPPGRMDASTYVLRGFSAAERKDLGLHVDTAADAVESLCRDGLERTQSLFNS